MSVMRDDSQQTSCNVMVQNKDGTQQAIASATCSLRPGRSFSFMVDVFDAQAVAANLTGVTDTIAGYMAEEFAKAQQCYRRVLEAFPDHPRARLFLKDSSASGDLQVDEQDIEAVHHRRSRATHGAVQAEHRNAVLRVEKIR